jgi:hypothetical protein
LEKNTEEVNLNGLITLVLKEILTITILKVKDNTLGQMEKVNKSGMMDLFTKDIGKSIWLMVLVDLFMPMEMSMKENGKKTKLMEKVNISIWMELNIMEIGLMTNNMALE